MDHVLNALGQPVGRPLPGWTAPPRPPRGPLAGRFCRLEPLEPEKHGPELFQANSLDTVGRLWTYLPYGPFDSLEAYLGWMRAGCLGEDPLFFAIIENTGGKALGVASYLRISPPDGVIEVGHINFSPPLQRTPAASEALYLLFELVFRLGYRRLEWKCDALNTPSRAAAERLGFRFEGVFRQAVIYRGRNRDTAWYSIIDSEWPRLDSAWKRWLSPSNFDSRGRQRERLSDLTADSLERNA
ncbi:GNAT family N-acetyltransferase [bacterium]|nr:GNAT family N-acetyltransferase [bacterium]